MDPKLISQVNFLNLLGELQEEYSVILPVRKGETRFYEPFQSGQSKDESGEGTNQASIDSHFVIGEVRAFEPLKSFYFQAKQRVAENYQDLTPKRETKPLCVVGAKACDLKGFKVLDTVFIDADARRLVLVWRATIPCPRLFLYIDCVRVTGEGGKEPWLYATLP